MKKQATGGGPTPRDNTRVDKTTTETDTLPSFLTADGTPTGHGLDSLKNSTCYNIAYSAQSAINSIQSETSKCTYQNELNKIINDFKNDQSYGHTNTYKKLVEFTNSMEQLTGNSTTQPKTHITLNNTQVDLTGAHVTTSREKTGNMKYKLITADKTVYIINQTQYNEISKQLEN